MEQRDQQHEVKLLYIYAPEDRALKDELKDQLRQIPVHPKDNDLEIPGGITIHSEVEKRFEVADIIFLLISSDFYKFDLCCELEKRSLVKYREKQVLVIRILASPLYMDNTNGPLTLPRNGKFLKSMNQKQRRLELMRVAADIRQEVDKILVPRYIQDALEYRKHHQLEQALTVYGQVLSEVRSSAKLYRELHHLKHTHLENNHKDTYTIISTELCINLGDTCCELKQFEKALSYYHEAYTMDTHNVRLCIARGAVLSQMEQWEQALQTYEEFLDLEQVQCSAQEKAAIYEKMGDIYSECKDYNKALQPYKDAITYVPLNQELLKKYTTTQLHIAAFHWRAATHEQYDEVLGQKPEEAHLFFRDKGNVFAHFGYQVEALDAYHKAITYAPESIDLYKELPYLYKEIGDAQYELKHFPEAMSAYEQAIKLLPDLEHLLSEKRERLLQTLEQQRNNFSYILQKYQKQYKPDLASDDDSRVQ